MLFLTNKEKKNVDQNNANAIEEKYLLPLANYCLCDQLN